MPHHNFDGISEEIRRQKLEQLVKQHHQDIIRILKRIEQRPMEWMGLLPHAADAFTGVTGGSGTGSGGQLLQGFLAEDLIAPENALGPPTTVAVDIYQPVSGTLVYVGGVTAYCYDTTLSGEAGTYCKCEWIDGQRQIYWLACEPTVLELHDTDGEGLLDTDGTQLLINL